MMQSIAEAKRAVRAGFSLVELLTVVVIIIILVAMSLVMPAYSSFRDRIACRGFATSVLTKTREAKNVSKALARDVSLLVDVDNDKVWIEVFRPDGTGNSDSYGTILTKPSSRCDIKGFHITNVGGSTITSGVCEVVFYHRGTAVAQAPLTASTSLDALFHVGLSTATYAAGASASDYRSIYILNAPGRSEMFDVGCVSSTEWQGSGWTWSLCRQL